MCHSVAVFLCPDCFSIYDLNDDGYISREEMFQMLKSTMVRQPSEEDPDEGIKDLVETMIKRLVSDVMYPKPYQRMDSVNRVKCALSEGVMQ
jgi:hypothetical protein